MIRCAIALGIVVALVGCVFVSGQGQYKRVDKVEQGGESNRINRTEVTIKP